MPRQNQGKFIDDAMVFVNNDTLTELSNVYLAIILGDEISWSNMWTVCCAGDYCWCIDSLKVL